MNELTLPQAKKYICVLWIFLGIMVVLLIYETNDFFGYQIYEEENLDYERGIDVGRTLAIMDIYPSPDRLQEALDNGEMKWDDLTPSLKAMMDKHGGEN